MLGARLPIRLFAPRLLLLLVLATLPAQAQRALETTANSRLTTAIWTDPGDIKSKNMLLGPGGEKDRPQLPVKFLKEDEKGQNSKFDVEDSSGTRWKAKLGIEAQPEIVATRLLWAIGYYTNENYFVRDLEVTGLPDHLHRGQGHVIAPGHVEKVRLQRHPRGKKAGSWNWRHSPFVGRREFNGLRVMMALLSNWDLKDENNAVYVAKDGTQHYMVTDVGTAFGASGNRFTEEASKNNLKAYRSAKFIAKVKPAYVDFNFPRFPPILFVFNLPHYLHQVHMRWVGNGVPRQDAKWVGTLLAQLSTEQIVDAFRSAGYPADQAAAFTTVVQARVAELNRL
jgi:hypothetical protein